MIHAALFQIVFQGFLLLAVVVVLHMLRPGQTVLWTLTKPIYKTVATVSPALWPDWSHGFLAVCWLLTLRVAFYMALAAYGLLPPVTA